MSADLASETSGEITAPARVKRAQQDPAWVRWLLTGAAVGIVVVLIVIPVINIFTEALKEGVATYWSNLVDDPDTRHSILLTLIVAPIALVANTIFGIAAAWAIAKFDFRGRTLLTALIDLPFAVSPVVAGLMFVLMFGRQGYFGGFLRRDGYAIMPYLTSALAVCAFILLFYLLRPVSSRDRRGLWNHPRLVLIVGGGLVFAVLFFLQQHFHVWPQNQSLKIIFAIPGLVLATAFITFPFVARELIPVMEALGDEEELAALTLGANGWQLFWHITVPNIKWGLAYGIILCNARAMGEFGAVYVVSGHIAGQTDTMPLRIEKLFQEYNLPGSFAVASLLTLVAIITLIAKVKLERKAPVEAAAFPAEATMTDGARR
ncbi:sulfate ABC transporter permease [Rhizobium mesoamericanum]|uniref:sulfate ABC transporter permease n=1 Tax=Rhizobium mesoamericanum TaxID=1079800 RepID=UPI000400C3F5|nr:ABC transporter permease subunit [Rhizobium mesoamericanum]